MKETIWILTEENKCNEFEQNEIENFIQHTAGDSILHIYNLKHDCMSKLSVCLVVKVLYVAR